jgi:hypothetical protein
MVGLLLIPVAGESFKAAIQKPYNNHRSIRRRFMNHKIFSLFAGVVLGVVAFAANAATISVNPSLVNVPAGTPQVTVSLDAGADFPATIGGAMSITWGTPDSILTLDHWDLGPLWDSTAVDLFAGYSLDPANGVTDLFFSPIALSVGPGPFHLIDLVYNVTGTGTANVNPTVSGLVQEWGDTAFNTIAVTTQGAMVNVSAVPLPAAGWLMLSGLAGLMAVSRRRRQPVGSPGV